uniref:rRNA-processing protein EBP2 n=1 Tax=Euplotes crassus TaxID=5936 RepID=A0A7S3KNM9_EUPCR|mmetsp:Transcript_37201/g.36789  ORF Transcript_37201/g.36789 Transcript_37201/m.36789 type:complete len:150 (+) Transcript_37201:435-884(+)
MLMQSGVKIGRPDDFFAEMMKSDLQMRKIKQKLLKQEEKIKQFEARRLRLDNKKFHRRIKAFKQETKSKEKKANQAKIDNYKNAMKNDNKVDESLDINQYLSDQKKKRHNVIELMRQQQKKRLENKHKGGKRDKKGRSGGHSRKMKKRR